jgi:hypothetical protein
MLVVQAGTELVNQPRLAETRLPEMNTTWPWPARAASNRSRNSWSSLSRPT